MPSFAEIRDAAIATLKPLLPQGTRCEAFEGELTLEGVALKRLNRAGAVLVTCIGAANTSGENSLDCSMRLGLGAFCISKNAGGAKGREEDALPLAQVVVRGVHGAQFGLAGVAPGKVLQVDNMFTAEFEKHGITVWAVTWEHHMVFG